MFIGLFTSAGKRDNPTHPEMFMFTPPFMGVNVNMERQHIGVIAHYSLFVHFLRKQHGNKRTHKMSRWCDKEPKPYTAYQELVEGGFYLCLDGGLCRVFVVIAVGNPNAIK
ncbi:MAG: hypothetical protein H6966_00650 [Chromatiaceae bacterium]|nr:hypothetical protein [Chromatiaceae bacterium]